MATFNYGIVITTCHCSSSHTATTKGESKHANIGISLPGTAEEPKAPVYVDGRLVVTLKGEAIVPEFLKILDEYVANKY